MKVLVHDGLGIWLCARRLEQGKFHWAQVHQGETVALSPEQLQALTILSLNSLLYVLRFLATGGVAEYISMFMD